jgi:hypothetical protein
MQIIEDHSPYYVKFEHDTLNDIIEYSKKFKSQCWERLTSFIHLKLSLEEGRNILSMVPKSKELELNPHRVSFFISNSKYLYRAHKDGTSLKFGINYAISIKDDLCETHWYDDNIAIGKEIDYIGGNSREIIGFVPFDAIPIKSFIMKPNEVVLFNTDIFHNWDNTKSSNTRIILTLRSLNKDIDFTRAKNILFN